MFLLQKQIFRTFVKHGKKYFIQQFDLEGLYFLFVKAYGYLEEAGVFLTYTLTDHGGKSKVKLLINLQSNFELGYSNQWTKNRAKELEMKVCIPN